jgi:hypothetical protein
MKKLGKNKRKNLEKRINPLFFILSPLYKKYPKPKKKGKGSNPPDFIL